jgi:hypothetical protein
MLNTWEMDTIREIKARVVRKQPVADWEKQLVLDLLRREGEVVRQDVIDRARNSGFNVQGIKTR